MASCRKSCALNKLLTVFSHQHSNVVSGELLDTEVLLTFFYGWAVVGGQVVLMDAVLDWETFCQKIGVMNLCHTNTTLIQCSAIHWFNVFHYPDVMRSSTNKESQVVHLVNAFRAQESVKERDTKHRTWSMRIICLSHSGKIMISKILELTLCLVQRRQTPTRRRAGQLSLWNVDCKL